MSWAQRRKTTYVVSMLFIFVIILAIILFSAFNKAPSCSDGVQNQGEFGIDCGGPCSKLCRAQFTSPVVIWGPRWEKVLSSGMYNFLTYIQNPNIGVGSYNATYLFKVYDKDNILLYQKTGVTFVPPNNNFVIFEDNINLNDKVPARTEFQFSRNFVWQKMDSTETSLVTLTKKLVNTDTRPKLSAVIKNTTINQIQNIESVAILYDENNNAVAFSKTKIDSIDGGSTASIVFTWPEPFSGQIVRIDIVSKVLPGSEF